MISSNHLFALIPGLQLSPAFLQAQVSIPWWVWVLLLLLLFVLLYFVIRGGVEKPAAKDALETSQFKGVKPAVQPDDLTIIEGIGSKINQVLQQAGIQTFHQLAAADVEKLEQILKDANLRLANPASWGEQARLAALGDWEGLKKLQDALKGGLKQ